MLKVEHISDDTLLDLFEYLIQEGYDTKELAAIMEYLFEKESEADADHETTE